VYESKSVGVPELTKSKVMSLRTLLVVTYSLQIVAIYSLLLPNLTTSFELVRQVSFIVLLTFIPGIYLLGFFRIKNIEPAQAVVFIVGLSIFFLFLCGLILLVLGFMLGMDGMLTETNFFIVYLVLSNLLIIMFLQFDCQIVRVEWRKSFNHRDPMIFMAILIPVMAVLGATVANAYQTNIVQIMTLMLILAAIVYVGFTRNRESRSYPWLLYGISLGLLLHTSLITPYLWGWDIFKEYYIARTVIENATWSVDFYSNINAMLSIVVLIPAYSLVTNTDLPNIFKVIYPMLFAFTPVALYTLFAKYTTRWVAFLSLVFAVSFFAFYFELPQLGRQEIGMLFMALFLVILLDTHLDMSKRSKYLLAIIFGFCMVVSHYGTTYLMLLIWTGALIIYALHAGLYQRIVKLSGRRRPVMMNTALKGASKPLLLNLTLLLFIALIALIWYTSVTNASAFKSITNIMTNILGDLATDLFNPSTSQGLAYVTAKTTTPMHNAGKYLQLGAQALIGLGILAVMLKKSRYRFPLVYSYLAFTCLFILVACLVVPNFAGSFNTSRILMIVFLIMAPMCVAGIAFLFDMLGGLSSWASRRKASPKDTHMLKAAIVIFLAAFLLFNTGLVYQMESTNHTSIALDYEIDYPRYSRQEVMGQEWLMELKTGRAYTDGYRGPAFNGYEFWGIDPIEDKSNSSSSLIYLGTYNLKTDTVRKTYSPVMYLYYDVRQPSTIYNDHGSIIVRT
jgi:uncharacterized membrane protein